MGGIRSGSLLVAALLGAACSGGDGGGTDPGPTTGTLVGHVAAGGANVQGAQVAHTGGSTQATGADGRVTFENVQAGAHTLTLQQLPQGFAMGSEAAAKQANVTGGGSTTVSWSVQAGPVQSATIEASGTSFSPANVTIVAGGTVRFEYVSGGSHTVTPENPSGSWTERSLESASDNFSVTFSTPGTYRFRCRPHSSSFTTGMVGVITVQ